MSKKKEAEGIALLSMYNDDDFEDDMDDTDEDNDGNNDNVVKDSSVVIREDEEVIEASVSVSETFVVMERTVSETVEELISGEMKDEEAGEVEVEEMMEVREEKTVTTSALNIVGYGQDETALSPDIEDGEIKVGGSVMVEANIQTVNGNFQERTPGSVEVLTPVQATPKPSEKPEPSKSDNSTTLNDEKMESDTARTDKDFMTPLELEKDVDPLDKFLPPPTKTKCSVDLQNKIKRFLGSGKSFNAAVRNNKEYRNPDFLSYAVRYQDIDEIGSCFNKDVFDPHGYERCDYYEEIEADMKREIERKEQEKKRSPKVEFIAGGTQPALVAQNINMQSSAVPSAAGSRVQSLSNAADTMTKDNRQNKKSKWDKVDNDKKISTHSGSQDARSTTVTQTSVSAAHAGAGYTAFAQQRRREAEERKSSERRRT